MESAQNVVFDKCVYTIVSSDVIKNAANNDSEGHFTEGKSWVKALELFKQTELEDKLFFLLLADAAHIRGVEWIAQVVGIEILPDGSTKISFAGLHPLEEIRPRSDLQLLSTGEAMSNSYIRPYALCLTPDFVYEDTVKILANIDDRDWVALYRDALQKIGPVISDGQRKMLLGHYLAPDMALSVKRLAEIAGYDGQRSGSLHYGKLARKLSEVMGIDPPTQDLTSMIAEWHGDQKDENGHGQWVLYDEVAQALEELGWVTKKAVNDEAANSNRTKQSFLLTWKEGNPPYKFEDFQEIETWRLRSHKQAKVGDEVYLLKQGKEPRGIFGRGVIIKSPYQTEDKWVVDVKIDEITNPSKSLFLTLENLCQMHPPEGLWFSQSSGIKIPDDVAEAMRNSKQWKINSITPVAVEPQDAPETSGTREVEIRIGQQQFRESLLQYWKGCSVTGCSFQEVLIASHIVPWSEASDAERLNVSNGLLLTPNLDKLFDNYFISFNSIGEILISKTIGSKAMHDLGINPSMKLRRTDEKLLSYLQKHERAFLEKEQAR
ncbi:MAG: HNH endonuclease [Nitrosomonadales bacterium]|nr:HNH endonuclease [Nitrosomonadales bacterium]